MCIFIFIAVNFHFVVHSLHLNRKKVEVTQCILFNCCVAARLTIPRRELVFESMKFFICLVGDWSYNCWNVTECKTLLWASLRTINFLNLYCVVGRKVVPLWGGRL